MTSAAVTEAVAEIGKTLADIPKDQLDYISSFLSHDSNKLFKPISKTFRAANSATHLTVKPHTHMLDYKVPYYETPYMIKTLTLEGCDVEYINFTRFTQLEEINLAGTKNLTPTQFHQFHTTLKRLVLSICNVTGVDFSRFIQLEKVELTTGKNLTTDQIRELPPTLKILDLSGCNVTGIDFTHFTQLEEII